MNPINTAGHKANIFEGMVQKVPAKRVGQYEDIAGAVLYLSSQAGVSSLLLVWMFASD